MGDKHFAPTRGLLILGGLVIGAVLIYNIYLGVTVQKLSFLGLNLEFGEPRTTGLVPPENIPQTSPQERENRQTELEQQLAELQQRLDEVSRNSTAPPENPSAQPQTTTGAVEPPAPALPEEFEPVSSAVNLTGNWYSDDGASYVVTQVGNYVTMQEFNPAFGLTAIITGTIEGDELDTSYDTVFGTTGEGLLTIVDDGNRLTGTFHDFTTGAIIPANIRR